ncbi:hypothetical protein V6N13_125794 [Hibiscus sabdariffa]
MGPVMKFALEKLIVTGLDLGHNLNPFLIQPFVVAAAEGAVVVAVANVGLAVAAVDAGLVQRQPYPEFHKHLSSNKMNGSS